MTTTAPFTRRDVALLLLLAALVALFFWRILSPNPADRAQFPAGDFTDQFYAFRLYQARAFFEGRIPLWSENFNSGHPFLADIQSAVFYPPALVNILLNLALFQSFSLFALELEALVHFFLAGAFTYLFARRTLSRAYTAPARIGAFTAALVFTFGGYLTSYPSLQLAILETAVWLPLALYFLDQSIGTTDSGRRTTDSSLIIRPSSLLFAALVLGVAALAGHPQTFLFVVSVAVIYFIWRVLQSTTTHTPRALFRCIVVPLALVLLIAFGVAAIQLVPAIEYQQLSTREALSFADAAKGFPTLDVLQFILPGYASAFASPLYVGILPLWLALFALLRKRNDTIFWGVLALGALILSFGFYVFAYVIFYLVVPGASLFRQQERLAFVVSFALAMLSGYGIMDLVKRVNPERARKLFVLLPIGAGLMLVLLLAFFVAGVDDPNSRLAFLGDRAGLMLVQFALASLLVGLYLRDILPTKWFIPLALVLILFDLWSVNEPANKGRIEDRFADIPFAQQLQSDPGVFRVAADEQILPGHFGIPTGLEEIGGISPLRLARYDALVNLPRETYLPLLNVKYVITRGEPVPGAERIAEDGDLELWQLQTPGPRAWLVGNVSAEDAAALTETNFANTAVVPAQAARALAALSVPDPVLRTGRTLILEHSAEYTSLNVTAPADSLLVLSENYYPGWQAAVDGQPIEIIRADSNLRAVPVSEGLHLIEFWYDPLSFKLGAIITLLTVIASVAALFYLHFAKRESITISS
ncbi:MAG: YfhO family protein [Anaerolineae bacterium]|nr:YfhO family protein [Anaerolineae bacterium]